MNKYEIMFIVKNTVDKSLVKKSVDALKSVVTDMKGEIIQFKELGQKALAYPIKKEISGFYYLLVCKADPATIAEFDRKAGIDENLLRHLTIRLDEE